ncbi:hypothetical protein MAM1_0324d09673 [Mucor ambiguus]|uniref:Uncharacterized protein n=1 Tax=Mucor ambiguus TaxID=91626 RepID=A0A0C9MH94_9FUNG|nr:hypothetical protein MAM1_0324d09673 [Mucor ambiguus]
MKLTLLATVFTFLMLNTLVMAQGLNWICTCFRPQYDRGCCGEVGYTMEADGNVCLIPRKDEASMEKFRTCCTGIEGYTKCK